MTPILIGSLAAAGAYKIVARPIVERTLLASMSYDLSNMAGSDYSETSAPQQERSVVASERLAKTGYGSLTPCDIWIVIADRRPAPRLGLPALHLLRARSALGGDFAEASLIVLRKTTEMSESALSRDLGDTTLRSVREQQRSGLVKPHIA